MLAFSASPQLTLFYSPKRSMFLVQKSHYKSTSIPKLKAAIEVYTGLCSLPSVKQQALRKLRAMLLHPYPQVKREPRHCTEHHADLKIQIDP